MLDNWQVDAELGKEGLLLLGCVDLLALHRSGARREVGRGRNAGEGRGRGGNVR